MSADLRQILAAKISSDDTSFEEDDSENGPLRWTRSVTISETNTRRADVEETRRPWRRLGASLHAGHFKVRSGSLVRGLQVLTRSLPHFRCSVRAIPHGQRRRGIATISLPTDTSLDPHSAPSFPTSSIRIPMLRMHMRRLPFLQHSQVHLGMESPCCDGQNVSSSLKIEYYDTHLSSLKHLRGETVRTTSSA